MKFSSIVLERSINMLWWFLLILIVAQCSGFRLPEILQSFEGNDDILSDLADSIATRFEKEYIKYQASGIETSKLKQIYQELSGLRSSNSSLLSVDIAELGLGDQIVVCTTCRATVNVVVRMFREPDGELNGPNKEKIMRGLVLDMCRRLNFESDDVCGGMFDFNWPVIDFILQNAIIDSRSMCGILPISFCSVKQKEYNWNLNVDKNDPSEESEKTEPPKKSDDDLVVLHLTDIHYDPLYKPGALADCGEVLCCQRENTVGESKAAGYWSDYRGCDSPWNMITDAFAHIKRTHKKIDMIYNTGDVVDHMTWGTSQKKNSEGLTKVNNLLAEVFPGIPVYSSVGNHETHPVNVFGPTDVPEEINVKWLYEHLNNLWRKWLPADTEKTIINGGYYTVTPRPGFRIISLNSNDCLIYNWWLFYNGSIMLPQMQWLHDTLLASEKAGEKVHILSHSPSGDYDCWTVWSGEFNRVVERFRHTISGIFNGHTHSDELNVHYTKQGNAVGISWNGGSLTSYNQKNPNYKIVHLTPKTMEVVDFETWIFNLTEANKFGDTQSPKWFREYTFSEEFTDDLSPAGLNRLLEKMTDNPKLLRKYWRFKHTSAEPRIADGCDKKCLSKVICRLSTTVYDQNIRCKELQKRLVVGLDNEVPDDGGNDSATAMNALQVSILIGLFCVLKILF